MITKKHKRLSRKFLGDVLLKGSRLAVERLVAERIKTDDHLIISRNGKVVKVKARDLR